MVSFRNSVEEYLAVNQKVAGSNPAESENFLY